MKTADRNMSGVSTMLMVAISVSSLRATSARPVESAASPSPRRIETASSTAMPTQAAGVVGADQPADADDDRRLDHRQHRAFEQPPADDRAARGRRHQEAVHDAAVDVLDDAHARPAAREHDGHDDDARHQVVDVGAAAEPRDLHDALEGRREDQQVDQRLDERDARSTPAAATGCAAAGRTGTRCVRVR